MASSAGLLVLMLTAAYALGAAFSRASYCGHDEVHTLGPYYWLDVIFLPNATDFYIASINGTKNTTTFGGLSVYNDPLRLGPLSTDLEVGRAQGIFVNTNPDLASGLAVFSFVLPKGSITFNCYWEAALYAPNQFNHCLITSGNGGYRDIVKGYTDLEVSSSASGFDQVTFTSTVTYCL